jgi:hypothetical protein
MIPATIAPRSARSVQRGPAAIVIGLISTLVAPTFIGPATAQAALRDDFESPQPAWRDVGGDARYRIERHLRIGQDVHSGRGCEFLEIDTSGDGSSIYLSYDIGQAPVIDELSASVWLRGTHPGARLFARVVFPRTLEPQTGRPVTAVIFGGGYDRPGQWTQLRITDVRNQVEQQARVLRAQLRLAVDTNEAYIDRLLLNVYAGQGRKRYWLDDLEVTGVVSSATNPTGSAPGSIPPASEGTTASPFTPVSRPLSSVARETETAPSVVELKGQTLSVRGRPFFPRIVDYQGEPLELLRNLGFNTVRLRQTPGRETLDEAARLGLWIVCPPPKPPELDDPYQAAAARDGADFGPWFAPVLAWDLGENLGAADVDRVKRWAEHVRRRDSPRPRPTLAHIAADLRLLSRQVDIVTSYRAPIGTSFELADYGAWLRSRSGLMRPGTPVWTVVQTQPTPELSRQARLFSLVSPPAQPRVESEQMRLLLFEALAAGVRGVSFASSSSLAVDDPATRARAATLRLLNAELDLIDVWGAQGTFVARLPGSEPDVTAALLQIDRGHVLLPLWTGAGAQFVPGQSSGVGLSFVVPGVPESVDVYEVSPGGLRPLERRRVAGGIRLTIDEFSLTSLILMTQDPQVVANIGRRLAATGPVIAQAQRAVAEEKIRAAESVQMQLRGVAQPLREADGWLYSANNSLRAADARLAAGALREGYLETRRALRPIALLERTQWSRAVEMSGGSPVTGPFTASFASLPEHYQMWRRIQPIRSWQDVLPGGEFENLDLLLTSGWRHYQFAQEGVESEADLTRSSREEKTPVVGEAYTPPPPATYCLRLAARPTNSKASVGMLESSPLWVESPPLGVRAGQLLRITGKVYVGSPITGSFDGLVIFDSIGGDVLAQRFDRTEGWRSFSYYRIAALDGDIRLTVALTGLGEALVDDLRVEVAQ